MKWQDPRGRYIMRRSSEIDNEAEMPQTVGSEVRLSEPCFRSEERARCTKVRIGKVDPVGNRDGRDDGGRDARKRPLASRCTGARTRRRRGASVAATSQEKKGEEVKFGRRAGGHQRKRGGSPMTMQLVLPDAIMPDRRGEARHSSREVAAAAAHGVRGVRGVRSYGRTEGRGSRSLRRAVSKKAE